MKKIWYPLLSTLSTMVTLYSLGSVFDIPFLDISFVYDQTPDGGHSLNIDMTLLPIIIGIIVGMIVDHKQTTRTDNLS